jgi:hypothetical protein
MGRARKRGPSTAKLRSAMEAMFVRIHVEEHALDDPQIRPDRTRRSDIATQTGSEFMPV